MRWDFWRKTQQLQPTSKPVPQTSATSSSHLKTLLDVLLQSGVVPTAAMARRLVGVGAVRIHNRVVNDYAYLLDGTESLTIDSDVLAALGGTEKQAIGVRPVDDYIEPLPVDPEVLRAITGQGPEPQMPRLQLAPASPPVAQRVPPVQRVDVHGNRLAPPTLRPQASIPKSEDYINYSKSMDPWGDRSAISVVFTPGQPPSDPDAIVHFHTPADTTAARAGRFRRTSDSAELKDGDVIV